MKLLPNVALALMLSLGATTMVTAPADAQKKKDDQAAVPEGPKLVVSKEFRTAAAAVDPAVKAKDVATAEAKLAIAEPLAKTDDERYYVAIYRLQIEDMKKNPPGVMQALDSLLANPKTPTTDLPTYNNLRGGIAVDLNQNAEAIPFLLKAREQGHTGADLAVSLAKAYGGSGKIKEAITELEKAIDSETAAGRAAPEPWYGYATSNLFALHDVAGAETWLVRQIKAYPKIATWRTAVGNFRKVTDPSGTKFTKAQKLDLFRMMRGTKALSDANDYYIYSNSALDSGLPWEAAAVIEEGRAAGKIPASDADIARIYGSATTAMKTEVSAATAAGKSKPAIGGDIYLAAGDYAKAAELYGTAAGQAGVDANAVNMHLGIALANLGRKDEAKAAFAKVAGAPLADIAHLWTIWLDMPQLA
jgi:predicted Zn-dependent protease